MTDKTQMNETDIKAEMVALETHLEEAQESTELGAALQAAYELTFNEQALPLATGGSDFATRPDQLTDRQIAAIFRYGKRALNDSYNSEAKIRRDAGEKMIPAKDFFEDWLAHLGTTKPRGGGSTLTPEVAGWLAYFKSKGSPVKFKGKTPSKNNLDEYQDAFTKNAIWPSVRNAIKDLDQDEQKAFIKERLPELVLKHKPTVLAKAQSDERSVKPFIDAELRKRNGSITETFKVEIDIAL